MGTGTACATKRTRTGAAVGGGARTGAAGAAKHMGAGATVGGGARTGTGTGAGMYTSSRGSVETSLTPAASSSAIVLGTSHQCYGDGRCRGRGDGSWDGSGGSNRRGQLVLSHVHEAPFLQIFYLLRLGVDFTKLED